MNDRTLATRANLARDIQRAVLARRLTEPERQTMILTQDQAAAVVRSLADLQSVAGSVERLNFTKTGGRVTLHYSEPAAFKIYIRQSGASLAIGEEWHRDIDHFRQAYRV